MRIGAILLAAGSGSRMGSKNKLLTLINGKTALQRSLALLMLYEKFEKIVIVVNEQTRAAMQTLHHDDRCTLVDGGADRCDSVYNGILKLNDIDIVAIHDCARCLTKYAVLHSCIESACMYGSGVAGMPVKDTIKRVDGQCNAYETLQRRELWMAQTPQVFAYTDMLRGYEIASQRRLRPTDDATVYELAAGRVHMIMGGYDNIKLTTPEDVIFAEALLRKEEGSYIRIGFGEDTHKLVKGRKLILGGVEIEYEKGLLGHSDADVLIHAVIDAILGAASLGDIGTLFPDNDAKYENISSIELLRIVVGLLDVKGLRVNNVDATIVAQEPKLFAYVLHMRENIAHVLAIALCAVSVKATTTEGMGFEGRSEGITARAVTSLHEA